MATELEFWDERTEAAIALVPMGDPAAVPGVGDWCVVPEAGTGMFATVQVRSRHFYYSAQGQLQRVRVAGRIAPGPK
jgi:hypothetical protein